VHGPEADFGADGDRVADHNGSFSFAGRCTGPGRLAWQDVPGLWFVASSVQLFYQGTIMRVHSIRHDPAKGRRRVRHPMIVPASAVMVRRSVTASRPSRYAVDPRAEP